MHQALRLLRTPCFALLLLLGTVLLLTGCRSEPMADDAPTTPAEEDSSMDAQIEEALAKLSPEERAAAEQQKICPVSGEPLGSMGTPMKVAVADREVFICCEGCEDLLKAEPEKYLAKLEPQP